MKILRVKQQDGTPVDIPIGVDTASSAVSTHNTNTSAYADIRKQISQLSSEKVDVSHITQEAGESESLVMSQKAVTNLVSEALGSGGTTPEYETDDSEGTAMSFKQVVITSDHTSIAYDDTTKHTVANDDQSHAIDFVTINKTTKTVNITRLGIGSDRSYTYN